MRGPHPNIGCLANPIGAVRSALLFVVSAMNYGQRREAARTFTQIKAPATAGAKRRGTDWSACMKNRHRVSQVVSKLICSRRFRSITDVYVGTTHRGQRDEAGGVGAEALSVLCPIVSTGKSLK